MPRELTKKELKSYKGFCTVGDLLKFIKENQIPDNALVLCQRVEDVYYEESNWGVYLKEGESTWECKAWNKNIKNKKYLNERPKLKEIINELEPFTEKQIKESMEQYHPVWSPVLYNDDKDDFLFLDLHY